MLLNVECVVVEGAAMSSKAAILRLLLHFAAEVLHHLFAQRLEVAAQLLQLQKLQKKAVETVQIRDVLLRQKDRHLHQHHK